MFCTHCQRSFDDKLIIPRLLILCGHSLCQSCCYRLHINNRVECPECHSSTFVESIALLPKNLALITNNTRRDLCGKHHKKYEAFCEKENVLICIECILQDGHKTHEMDSIHNCYEKYRNSWSKKMQKIEKCHEKQTQLLTEHKGGFQEYKQNHSQVKQSIISFFKQLREVIDKEQQNSLQKIRQLYTQTETKFQQKIKTTISSLDTLTSLQTQLNVYHNLNQIEFLDTYEERQQLYSSANQTTEESIKAAPLVFSKKNIVESLAKTFQTLLMDKTQKKQSSNYNTISNQLKKSNQPQAIIKAVRKMPITPPTPMLSSQNRKKVSSKKQGYTPTNQPCIVISKITTSPKQKADNNSLNQIHNDISAVDPKQSLCHSFMSNMTSFLSQRKSIYLIGGFNEEANNIIKLNLFNFNWEEVCPLNSNRSKFGSINLGKQIYLFGGKRGKERVADSELYNATINKWSRLTPMNKTRSGFAVISIAETLYFVGGNDGDSILSTVQTLNLTTGEWKRKESMNEPRDELAVVVGKNNKIYAIGGFGGRDNQPLKSVQVYDPKIQKWKFIPPMNQPRRALAAAVLADGIYAIGGFEGTSYLSTVQKYQQGQKQWVYVAQMNQSRCTHSAVSIFQSQQIYVFGGFDYVPLDSVQRYNVISNEWESICRMPTPRFMHSSLVLKED